MIEINRFHGEVQCSDKESNDIISKKVLKIVHLSGVVELNIDVFFPCKLNKARQVFILIKCYSSMEEKNDLLLFMQEKESKYAATMAEYVEKVNLYPEKSKERRHYLARFKEVKILRQRMERNIEIFLRVMNS